MTGNTYLFKGKEKKCIETLKKFFEGIIEELEKGHDIIMAPGFTGGQAWAPSKKTKLFRTLPFGLAPKTFTEKGLREFWFMENAEDTRPYLIWVMNEGSVNYE